MRIPARILLDELETLNMRILNPYKGSRFCENDRQQIATQMRDIRKLLLRAIKNANHILSKKDE